MDFQTVKMTSLDVFDLLCILTNYIEIKNAEIKQAEDDEKAGKPLTFFDNYGDFIAALDASKKQAKTMLKDLQKQTGMMRLAEEAIEKL